jgi:hypothetical protein
MGPKLRRRLPLWSEMEVCVKKAITITNKQNIKKHGQQYYTLSMKPMLIFPKVQANKTTSEEARAKHLL